MTECIFCKIVSREIPAEIIYEDDYCVAFLDIHPHALGHTVVIPRLHYESLQALQDENIGGFFKGVKNTLSKLIRQISADGCTIGINEGEAAGQAVPHLHVHLLPRFINDGGGSIHSVIKDPPKESIRKIAEKIRNGEVRHEGLPFS